MPFFISLFSSMPSPFLPDSDEDLLAEMATRPELVEKFVLDNIDLETLNR